MGLATDYRRRRWTGDKHAISHLPFLFLFLFFCSLFFDAIYFFSEQAMLGFWLYMWCGTVAFCDARLVVYTSLTHIYEDSSTSYFHHSCSEFQNFGIQLPMWVLTCQLPSFAVTCDRVRVNPRCWRVSLGRISYLGVQVQ